MTGRAPEAELQLVLTGAFLLSAFCVEIGMQVARSADKGAGAVGSDAETSPEEVHTRRTTKAARLARPWPLLRDGQDPASLEARVAFHLHRTGCVGSRLTASSFLSRPALQSLAQGRFPLRTKEVGELAKSLGLSPRELLRNLSSEEAAAWAFYRTSARHRLHVWGRARACWELAGVSTRLAAAIMQMRSQNVTLAFNGRVGGRVLSRGPASALSRALDVRGGAETFLMFAGEMLPPEHKIEDVVAPLTNDALDSLKSLYLRA